MEDFFLSESAPIGSLKGQLPEILRPTFDSESQFKDVVVMQFSGKKIPYSVEICTVSNEIHCFPSSFIVHPNTVISVVFRSLHRHKIAKSDQGGSPIVIFRNQQQWFTMHLQILEE